MVTESVAGSANQARWWCDHGAGTKGEFSVFKVGSCCSIPRGRRKEAKSAVKIAVRIHGEFVGALSCARARARERISFGNRMIRNNCLRPACVPSRLRDIREYSLVLLFFPPRHIPRTQGYIYTRINMPPMRTNGIERIAKRVPSEIDNALRNRP